jgi:lysyl-tRNA synthetase class 2
MSKSNWQPTASLQNLQLRANLLKEIRQFFEARNVLEVETPLLGHSTATDPYLASFTSDLVCSGMAGDTLYLQTSPEFSMKRLIAAGYGSIFQICKAFRNGEIGNRHNPEFTILEWYRVGFNHVDLMDEMDHFLMAILSTQTAERISYEALFQRFFSINPHTCSLDTFKNLAEIYDLSFVAPDNDTDRDTWLDLLMTHIIEPELGHKAPLFVYDYPQSQAALAVIRQETNYQVGERFEVYYQGIELANGYHELCDATEQSQRLQADNQVRALKGLPIIPIDQNLLDALPFMPACAGVALGIDRLISLAAKATALSEVITFPITHA